MRAVMSVNSIGKLAAMLCAIPLPLALALTGCGDDDPKKEPADAGSDVAQPFEAGSLCPDKNNARVHYDSDDPNVCQGVVLTCTTEQNGFNNRCGCGCIDKGSPLCPAVEDPAITFISRDPAQCGSDLPYCKDGQIAFNNTCGCGCTSPGDDGS